ncbi:db4775cd-5840-4107-a235-7fb1b7530d64 [Thermothielavioides terrestris]|uniref:DUF7582 domain-containing protein n=2 Tax=Thermothielavioides terrestris TaxID=2587410 RepID=G2RBU0_THETT|nr:uncharacterized protein THITE_2119460 [Thermothielavioides terrestris NRRL 8126]AEO69261.1 hypothetical protein THITE_2119460 [Thermothielavioides terrestris NRRL 8126]SPQ22461.1 db4775cd-5840-4107-a235-7fb1b7530d64 [Thermothielavioides terrestris]
MPFSPRLRDHISSPLEAGPSIADGHHLPSQVGEALEYASKRLGRKAAHITLLVVRRDYQLPTSPIASPSCVAGSPPVSAASTPSRPAFPPTPSRLQGLKQLVRPGQSGEGQIRERIVHVHLEQFRNGTASPAFSEASTASSVSTANSTFSYRMRWPGSPAAYGSVPVTPATPFTVMSSLSGTDGTSAVSQLGRRDSTPFGMRLIYAHPLSPREEKHLSQALAKAARKFNLDGRWLSQAVSPSVLGLPVDLVVKSTAQNEVLFSSEHLTLVSLDHLYTFRAALQAYARTHAPSRLEDAVDELRRLFLAGGRRPLRKSALLAAYRWLGPVDESALADVCRMYERAYGGVEKESGVEDDVGPVSERPLAEGSPVSGTMDRSLKRMGLLPLGGARVEGSTLPRRERESCAEFPASDSIDALDKEILLPGADIGLDEEPDLDAIEAWYREVQDNASAFAEQPSRSHSASTAHTVTVAEMLPPSPSRTPPPAPTSPTPPSDPWPQPDALERELSEMRRTTPKLHPAPPGRSLRLKLQTSFAGKSVEGGQKHPAATEQQNRAAEQTRGRRDDHNEDELTARPHSAVISFANVRWTACNSNSNNGVSIDELLHGGGGGQPPPDDDDVDQAPQREMEDRIGPMTPNGYDDISPITRGEWGLLMFGKGKTAKVETC